MPGDGRRILPPNFVMGDRRPSHELAPVGGHRHVSADWGAIPDNLEGVPFPVWGKPPTAGGDSNVAVHQVAQHRWVKVTASIVFGEVVKAKLIDGNDKPYIDPAWPPMAFARRTNGDADIGVDDTYWNDLQSNDVIWRDGTSSLLPVEDLNDIPMVGWYLRRVNDPVPCWEITIVAGYYDTGIGGEIGPDAFVDVNIDLFGAGIGGYSADTIDITVPDGQSLARIWHLTTDNSAVDHGDSPTVAAANELMYMNGAHDTVRNDATWHYLTTDGTSTGADIYDTSTRPAVLVLADPQHAGFTGSPLKAGGAETTWRPGSHGRGASWGGGYIDPYVLRSNVSAGWGFATSHLLYPPKYFARSIMVRDTGTGRWRVSMSIPPESQAGTPDRTFYIFAVGKVV